MLQELADQKEKERRELADQKEGKERRDWAVLFNALLQSWGTGSRRPLGDVGWGKKIQKRRRTSAGIEKPIQQHPNSRGDIVSAKLSEAKPRPKFVNKPLSNFDLLKWIDFLKIPNFKGIFARDEVRPQEHSPCIINLDELENAGTHWVCCAPGQKFTWYFDSFGLGFPQEFKSSKPVIWNSSQYQNINSVLCGYYCLYFLHQWSLGKGFYDILKPLSLVDTSQNEKFIKEYFD